MRKKIALGLVAIWLSLLFGCGRPEEQPMPKSSAGSTPAASEKPAAVKTHQGRGRVVDIDTKGRYIVIRHQEIPGFMDPMTMPFHLRSPTLAKSVAVGDEVEFTLEETPEGVLLTEIRKLPSP